jgi:sporulation integral membrane protein YtvI
MEMKKNFVINAAFYGILALLVIFGWKYLLPAMMPFIIGFVIASIVQFPLNRLGLKKPGHRKLVAAGMCIAFYALLVFLATFFSMKIIKEIGDFAMSVPDLFYDSLYPLIWDLGDQIQLILEPIDMTLAQLVNEVGKTLASTLAGYATKFSAWAVRTVATGAVSIPGALIQLIIIVVSSFYMAADYQTVIGFLTGLIPRSHRDSVVKVVSYARTAVVAYIKSYSIMFCITFLELWIGLSLLKIPYELGLAFGIAVFDLMPILGVGGILLPWGGIALILGNLKMGIGIIALYLVIAAVRNTVEPRIVGKEIGLHPLATLVAMVVGLRLIGLVGMLMLPITMVAIVKLREGSLNEQAH